MNGKYLLIVLLGATAALPERYGQYKPPVDSYSYREPKPAASGPEARALTPPQATPYRFSYEVDSAETGDQKSASESRDDDGVVRGQYSYVDAAGSLRTVRYMASASTGFVVEQDLVPGFAEPPPVRSALSGAGAAPVSRTALPEDGEDQEQAEAEAEREREEKKKKKEEEELRKKQEEEAKRKEEEEKRREAEQKRKEEELKKKREEEAKRKEEEQKRKEEKQRIMEEEEARLMEEEAKKREEAERKKQEEERLKQEQEESDRAHYEAEKKRQEAAAKERERLRRLFGVGQAQLVQLPQPLLVQSPTVTLLRSRPPVAAFIPPVAGVRIRGRGIDIAY